eukprot:TRINITY_DN1640_c0_g1_i2.p1 TRINITY_DN1640_c0_g1~~TRINITY_DN1640_c0_g1_i2.p1  ORF type:complete len:413 (-),score=73.23 TRINITY_DN1640_c0_g1_i2:29-1267(-)
MCIRDSINAEYMGYGVIGKSQEVKVNWSKVHAANVGFTGMINQMVGGMVKKMNIDLQSGVGELISPNAIKMTGHDPELILEADNILLATGSKPVMPKIPGIEFAECSDKFFEMTELPKSITIIGGGYIGVEIANCLHSFGVHTQVCLLEKSILPAFDTELAGMEMEYMKRKGIVFFPETEVIQIESKGKKLLSVKTKNQLKNSIESEMVMMAVGRAPNTANMGMEKVGVKLGERGEILVDEYDQTSIPGIFAVGDAVGKVMLTPVARNASKLLSDRLFGPGQKNKDLFKMDYSLVPSAVFSEPPIAKVGLTSQEAEEKFSKSKVKVYTHKGFSLAHALINDKEPFVLKAVCVENNGEEQVVGLHGLGRNVDEIIGSYALAMKKGITKLDLMKAIPVHPTGAEELLNLFQFIT